MGYDDWAAYEFWFIEEAAQLCFYPDPIDHDYESYDYVPDGLPMECELEIKHLYERIRRAIRGRALRAWHETDDFGSYRFAVKPMDFVSWCKSEAIKLPTELVESVNSFSDMRMQSQLDLPSTGEVTTSTGRPPKYDWDLFYAEIIRIANTPDGLPEKQADLVKQMLSWFSTRFGDEPSESTVKKKIINIEKYLDEVKKSQD